MMSDIGKAKRGQPQTLTDDALEDVEGAGVLETPAGGFGQKGAVLLFDEADAVVHHKSSRGVFEPDDKP